MNMANPSEGAWRLLLDSGRVCKPLLWLRDTDSPLPLAPDLLPHLRDALSAIVEFPDAVGALCDKMVSIYDRALRKPWVGIGAQPRSSRLGGRTAAIGLMRSLEHAKAHQEEFSMAAQKVKEVWATGSRDWKSLFDLTHLFIDDLDWGEFVIENARGQASNLVLESVELLQSVAQNQGEQAVREEIGDVFYNLMACCLSLRIGSTDVIA